MKRILFVIGDGVYPSKVGGLEIFNYYLIKHLLPFYTVYYFGTKKLNYCGAKFLKVFNIRPVKFLFPFQLFVQLIFHNSIDKVIFSFNVGNVLVWEFYYLVMRLLHKDYVLVIHHGMIPPEEDDEFYTKFFSRAHQIVAVSDDIKKNYDNKFGTNCIVIYPLVPFETPSETVMELRRKYSVPLNVNVICMVGTIKEMKNPDTIVKTISTFTETELEFYNPYVVFAGTGPCLDDLRKMVRDLKVGNRVSFLGFIPKENINEIMKLSDIYLIASDFEGTSVSLLEAMYNKMPIIASRVPGIVDTVTENQECMMFEVRNVEDLKEKFKLILDDKLLSKYISQNAYSKFNKRFNYQNVIDSYKKIL